MENERREFDLTVKSKSKMIERLFNKIRFLEERIKKLENPPKTKRTVKKKSV